MDLSLVHYGSRVTGEHIWITHLALIKQLPASLTGLKRRIQG